MPTYFFIYPKTWREACAALQFLHILANQLSEAEATLKTATSMSKFKQTDFSSAPNHAAMKPIANWVSTFATNRECWKAIVKNFVVNRREKV